MESSILVNILIIISSIIITIVITFIVAKKQASKEIIARGTKQEIAEYVDNFKSDFYKSEEYIESQKIKYERGKEDGKNEALIKYKESQEFKSFIDHEFMKGVEQGKNDALNIYRSSLEYKAILNNEYHKGRKEGIQEALKEYKESNEYKGMLENEFRRGKEEGQREEMRKFTIKYDTWVDFSDGFFNQHYIDGYNMQLFYNNMPIGDSTRRVLTTKKKFKEENLKYLVDQLKWAVEKSIQISTGIGIPTQLINREPKRIESEVKVD